MQPYDKSFKLSQPKTEWKVSWHSYKSENQNIKDIKNIICYSKILSKYTKIIFKA